jgi:hypothetical protein
MTTLNRTPRDVIRPACRAALRHLGEAVDYQMPSFATRMLALTAGAQTDTGTTEGLSPRALPFDRGVHLVEQLPAI